MGFFKSLFGGKIETAEEREESNRKSEFEMFKFDGVKAIRMSQFDYAVKCLEKAMEINGDDLEVRDYLSQALVQTNRIPEALAQLKVLAASQPDNIEIPLRMAHVAYLDADYESMGEACQKALEIDATDKRAIFQQARALKGKDEKEAAIDALDKAVETDEMFGDARLLRGQIALALGDTDKADADALWLSQHTEDNEDVIMLQADIEKAKGNNGNALSYLNHILDDLNPFNAEALRRRSVIKREEGDETGADEDLAQANDINPEAAVENIEAKVNQAYKDINPFGI